MRTEIACRTLASCATSVARVSSFVAIFLGGYFGWWVATLVFQWLSDQVSAEEIGAVWGSRVAAVTAIWKSCVEAVDSLRGAWKYIRNRDSNYDHIKALFEVATIMFGLTLGFMTFVPGFKSQPPPVAGSTELVYVVSHQGREAPSFMVAPTLVFRSAGLANPSMDPVSNWLEAGPDAFIAKSVSLSDRQVASVSQLVRKLAEECIFEGATQRLVLQVQGFANDLPLRDNRKQKRVDSDVLNLAVANWRGKAVYEAASTSLMSSYPSLQEEVSLKWTPWNSIEEMKHSRDHKVFRNVQIALSEEIDHRSSVIVVEQPGTCPQLVTPSQRTEPDNQGNSNLDAQQQRAADGASRRR